MDLFQTLNHIYEKPEEPVDVPTDDPFMVIRWLSLNPKLTVDMARMSKWHAKLPKWAIYPILFFTVPKQSPAPRFRYPKKMIKEDKYSKVQLEIIKQLQKKYKCEITHAEQIYKILTLRGIDLEKEFGQKVVTQTTAKKRKAKAK